MSDDLDSKVSKETVDPKWVLPPRRKLLEMTPEYRETLRQRRIRYEENYQRAMFLSEHYMPSLPERIRSCIYEPSVQHLVEIFRPEYKRVLSHDISNNKYYT